MNTERQASIRTSIKKTTHMLVVFAAIIGLAPAHAHWQLNNTLSQLNFLTTKAGNITETHSFKSISGGINDAGEIHISIDTASIDTLIPIRDERMRAILLKSEAFPSADFKGIIDAAALKDLSPGSSKVIDVQGELTLVGASIPVVTTVLATKVNGRALLVNTLKPILLDAGNLGLAAAVEELRELAGLPSISLSVPVVFTLTFQG